MKTRSIILLYKKSYAANPEIANGFYRGNGDGTFTKLAKTYNTNLTPEGKGAMCFTDYNMDGLPDVLRTTDKGNLMINESDFDLSFESHDFIRNYKQDYSFYSDLQKFTYSNPLDYERLIDINNDGYIDYIYYYHPHIYGVDLLGADATDVWTEHTMFYDIDNFYKRKYFKDLNNDGLIDVLLENSEGNWNASEGHWDNQYGYDIYIQQTDGSFAMHNHITLGEITPTIEDIADFDNDGYMDLAVIKDSLTVTIYLGSKDFKYSQTAYIHLPHDFLLTQRGQISANRDIDNNGYIDMLFSKDNIIVYKRILERRSGCPLA